MIQLSNVLKTKTTLGLLTHRKSSEDDYSNTDNHYLKNKLYGNNIMNRLSFISSYVKSNHNTDFINSIKEFKSTKNEISNDYIIKLTNILKKKNKDYVKKRKELMNLKDPIKIIDKNTEIKTNRESINHFPIKLDKYIFYKQKDSISSIDSSLSELNYYQKESITDKVKTQNLFFANNVISIKGICITDNFPKLGKFYSKSLSSRTILKNNKDKSNIKNLVRKVIL